MPARRATRKKPVLVAVSEGPITLSPTMPTEVHLVPPSPHGDQERGPNPVVRAQVEAGPRQESQPLRAIDVGKVGRHEAVSVSVGATGKRASILDRNGQPATCQVCDKPATVAHGCYQCATATIIQDGDGGTTSSLKLGIHNRCATHPLGDAYPCHLELERRENRAKWQRQINASVIFEGALESRYTRGEHVSLTLRGSTDDVDQWIGADEPLAPMLGQRVRITVQPLDDEPAKTTRGRGPGPKRIR